MTHTQDTNEKIQLHLKDFYVAVLEPQSVFKFWCSEIPTEASGRVESFIEDIDNYEYFVRFFSSPKPTGAFVFRLKSGTSYKCICDKGVGYFFDITDQIQAQSQVVKIVHAASECIRDHMSITDAMKVVERTIRFE